MPTSTKAKQLDPEEARLQIASEGARAIDVRSLDDFGDGHIAGAINSSAEDIEDQLSDLPSDAQIIVVCEKGKRSKKIAKALRDEGHNADSIKGGMKAWNRASLPVQPGEDYEFEGPGGAPGV